MIKLFKYAKEDYKAYGMRKRDLVIGLFTVHNFYAILLYRLSNYFHFLGLKTFAQALRGLVKVVWSMDISPTASIGYGFRIIHTPGVVIGDNVIIGDYCCLFQNVTLGGNKKEFGSINMPILDNGVTIYAGACVLGPVWISRGSEVGANSVLTKSVVYPMRVLAGIPAKEIKQISYPPQSLISMSYRKDFRELLDEQYKYYQ